LEQKVRSNMDIDSLTVNTIRLLSADSIQKANSGHPGLPLGAAPAAYALWARNMKHDPRNPDWPNRDRFVLSAGHGSAMLYSMLHLFGYGLTLDDLKNFRQFGSKTPGHPEYGTTPGVEMTTGPLGQGLASAVGMAAAEAFLAEKFNRPGFNIVDHYTFALCGDGCLMEGVSYEAASLAGALGLDKLIFLYDSNNISIEGSTSGVFEDDAAARFAACGWRALVVEDGNDVGAISAAIKTAKTQTGKPTVVIIKTQIGCGSPNKAGKSAAHGEPLGAEELRLTKSALGFDPDKSFFVPDEVAEHMEDAAARFSADFDRWNALMDGYKKAFPADYDEFWRWLRNEISLPEEFFEGTDSPAPVATRSASEKALNSACRFVPNLIGGAADLAPSTKSVMSGKDYFSRLNPGGANMRFGVREHAMGAVANGIALHGGLRPYVAGFFVFSDYMKPSMRMAALMKLPVIYVFTHDSIGVGEDGPTHQPVEQLSALRGIPGMTVVRPCDLSETFEAWRIALEKTDGPTAIILTRQNLPPLVAGRREARNGAYILRDCEGSPELILIASGSEASLACAARDELTRRGVAVRVVNMPSWELFEKMDKEYRDAVLPPTVRKRLAIEAASPLGWHKYVGLDGDIVSMPGYGESGPADKLFEKFGFTVANVVERALRLP
jgi:transketolase